MAYENKSAVRFFFNFHEISDCDTKARLEQGIVYLPEDRQVSGLYLDSPLTWNVCGLTYNNMGFWLDAKKESAILERIIGRLELNSVISSKRPELYPVGINKKF